MHIRQVWSKAQVFYVYSATKSICAYLNQSSEPDMFSEAVVATLQAAFSDDENEQGSKQFPAVMT